MGGKSNAKASVPKSVLRLVVDKVRLCVLCVFRCFRPCERMRKHAFTGPNTQHLCHNLRLIFEHILRPKNSKAQIF